ncbi:unnamed protein product [Blepharisma stoltei]|uniref:Uncharacterized protein n=1 Tax=Blepharisma stoltei TaxID=1481888 RepID=A0AAU9JM11_9CILI|nr:unnamed protein product [Blepharisma stoltei]
MYTPSVWSPNGWTWAKETIPPHKLRRSIEITRYNNSNSITNEFKTIVPNRWEENGWRYDESSINYLKKHRSSSITRTTLPQIGEFITTNQKFFSKSPHKKEKLFTNFSPKKRQVTLGGVLGNFIN